MKPCAIFNNVVGSQRFCSNSLFNTHFSFPEIRRYLVFGNYVQYVTQFLYFS